MIDIVEKPLINGLKQKIHILGENASLPVMLYLHGGPGIPNRASLIEGQFKKGGKALKENCLARLFLLVAYDQRGTGGSFKGAKKQTMTLDTMIEDVNALVNYLCGKLKKDKIYLMCGSWGTELGTFFIKKYPEKIRAYIGTGQTVNGILNEELSYNFACRRAIESKDEKSISALKALGAPKNGVYKGGVKGLMKQRSILNKFGGFTAQKGLFESFVKPILFAKEYSLGDKLGIIRGTTRTLSLMWESIVQYDFMTTHTVFEAPYYILQGRQDNTTPSALVQDFFDGITAPRKEIFWFENSAHHVSKSEPEKYIQTLKRILSDEK